MNMVFILLLFSLLSQGWQGVWRHELTHDSWVHFDKFTDCFCWWFLPSLPHVFSPFCRSPHFHGVTIERAVLVDNTVKHFQITNVMKSKFWWDCVSSWLVNRFQSSWWLSWWIYCWFTQIETLALHLCAWGRCKLLAGFWRSDNLFYEDWGGK